jgi:antitoxin component of RelBE/YafQ-DinJ toxin-antitoxin module
MPRLKTKSFNEYIKARFSKEEIEKIEREAELEFLELKKCQLDHTPNATTKKAIEDARKRKGTKSVDSVEELFKELRK